MAVNENIHFDLREYPHSIVNEHSIMVLLWIELSGLATCAQISYDLGMNEHAVRSVIAKLLDNHLLQFYNGFIQPSEKGKFVLDRIVIDKLEGFHDIIAIAFSFNKLTASEVNAIRKTMLLYREKHYTNYLFTMNSLKVWRGLYKARPYADGLLNEFIVSIIIYDLKKTFREVGVQNEMPLYFNLLYQDKPMDEMALFSAADSHLKVFNALLPTKDFSKYASPLKCFYEYLYCKDFFFSDKIQIEINDTLYAQGGLNVSEVLQSYLEEWKNDFLGIVDNVVV